MASNKQPLIVATETENEFWNDIVARNKSADGKFLYAVISTNIYCRPSCPSRRAKRENILFYKTEIEAKAAGFRACKRCRPDQGNHETPHKQLIEQACRLISTSEDEPTLKTLSKAVNLSPAYFQRIFKLHMGLTPKAYAKAIQSERVRKSLISEGSITSAIYQAGYKSNSRFYEHSNHLLGMSPTSFRKGGKNMQIYFAIGLCQLGHILVAQSIKGICAILLGDHPEDLVKEVEDMFPKAELIGADKKYEKIVSQVIALIEKPHKTLNLPLDIQGTAFQQKVWQALKEIPPGTTISYSELAQKIGKPKATRAVATACANNKIAIAIPCHRVVRKNGDLSGYRWGIERKQQLIETEKKT